MTSLSTPRTKPLRRQRHADSFEIVSGALGPVPKCKLEIRPLTVFIGRQGTGKSLIAQSLYLFEELPFLMYFAAIERGSHRKSADELFRWVLDRLRSSDRAFATFANKNVHVKWTRSKPFEWPATAPTTLDFRAYRGNRQVKVAGSTGKFVQVLRKAVENKRATVLHHAIFLALLNFKWVA